jgi:predicted Co/Zn/Cd cation transporter (cation efflux family)
MSQPRRRVDLHTQRRALEMVLFLVVSGLGVYALGTGLAGLFEPGRGINPGWLAVVAVTVLILFSQMGRVHDSWPHREIDTEPKEGDPLP